MTTTTIGRASMIGVVAQEFIADLNTVITVLDREALLALPAGTIVTDRDGDRYIRIEDGEFRDYYDDGPYHKETAHWIAEYAPAFVLNPEILGTFSPTEVGGFKVGDKVRLTTSISCYALEAGDEVTITELRSDERFPLGFRAGAHWLALDEVAPKLRKGDRVRILSGHSAFIGYEAIVGDGSELDGPHRDGVTALVPVRSRPDGFGMSPFWYDTDELELVVFEVGSRVKLIDNEQVWTYEDMIPVEAGALGTVTEIEPGTEDSFLHVKLDDGRQIGGYFSRRYVLTDEPAPVEVGEIPTVQDREGLAALPNGTVLVDHANDEIVVVKLAGQWLHPGFAGREYVTNWTVAMGRWADSGYVFLVKHLPA